jgi:Mg-chelatase subunit ChlD
MAGDKFAKSKLGAVGFAKEAISRGYSVGLIGFYGIANHICEPTKDIGLLQSHIDRLRAKKAGKARRFVGVFHTGEYGTNIAAAIRVARKGLTNRTGPKAVVVITDGQPNARGDPNTTLKAGRRATSDGIDIITIGTDDADQRFLKKLASATELSMKVSREAFQETIVSAANLLSDGK